MDKNLKDCVKSLLENDAQLCVNAQRELLCICNKVLRSPNDDKSREVLLSEENFINNILPADGAMQCLFEVGYVEDGERIFLPYTASLYKIQELSYLLLQQNIASTNPRGVLIFKSIPKKFYREIIDHYQSIIIYQDPVLQKKALKIIPIHQLEIATMKTMRKMQKYKLERYLHCDTKKKKKEELTSLSVENDLTTEDIFLVKLVEWFKNKFFTWVNKPMCKKCSIECVYTNTVKSAHYLCSNVELYRCPECNQIVEFARYHHPEPLLTLRRGRCGEWANVFTLLCISLHYDARLVWDETDHIWTEVWSASREQWIHVDPCENVINKPLIYEKGWKKKLTYVIAYSKDEVQDVTWRYTENPEAVLKRRQLCPETDLVLFLRCLSNYRQTESDYSKTRRRYVINRTLRELAEMIYIPNSKDNSCKEDDNIYEGRKSGSLEWRLARGEFGEDKMKKGYIWKISDYGPTFEMRYNIVKDVYYVIRDNQILKETSGWLNRVYAMEGEVFRKVENDWNMVYLARSEGAVHGRLQWAFEITNSELYIDSFVLKAKSEVFHKAKVTWEAEIISDDDKIVIPVTDSNNFYAEVLQKVTRLNIIVTLSGGEGETAWQHAQLFREHLKNIDELSMTIIIQTRTQACNSRKSDTLLLTRE